MDKPPLFVDLDGTLFRGDLLFEGLLHLAKERPLSLFVAFGKLFGGRSGMKDYVARQFDFDAAHLPYNEDLLAYLREEKARGRRIVLATASHKSLADKVAEHVGVFDDVLATTAEENLKGRRKLRRISDYVENGPFAYAGDSPADAPIWDKAASAIFVNAPRGEVSRAEKSGKTEAVLRTKPSPFKAFLKAMRPHQWSKNALVFLPLFTAHLYADWGAVNQALLAFLSFSLCASGVYFVNDLLDLQADRAHPRKRRRPFAKGDLSALVGVFGAILLFSLSLGVALLGLPAMFLWALLAYFVVTNLYSFWLKKRSSVDVLTLAALYTLRIIAGAAAIAVTPSFWILAFSMFLFLSLAYLKRYSELSALPPDKRGDVSGRGYSATDREGTFILGSVAGMLSVLVIALYINSPDVVELYQTPILLWGLCPALLFWINRIWVGAGRGKIDEDPVVFAIKDPVSLATVLFCLALVIAAHYITL